MRNLLLLSASVAVMALGCGDDTGSGGAGTSGSTTGSPASGSGNTKSASNSASANASTTNATASSATTAGTGLADGPSSERLTLRPEGTTNAPLGFAEYLPPGYGDGTKRPLLLFLHGIGENGTGSEMELDKLFNTGLPRLIEQDEWPSERPFVVLASQHPGGGCHSSQEIEGMLAYGMENYDVDPKKVYITGLSCGAIGGWGYLGAHTDEVVAAAVLIAGDGNGAFNQAMCDLGKVPIWALHGDDDATVNVSGSINPIENLNECTDPAPIEAKLTVYPGVGHNSWDRTYDLSAGNDIYAWMLGYTHP